MQTKSAYYHSVRDVDCHAVRYWQPYNMSVAYGRALYAPIAALLTSCKTADDEVRACYSAPIVCEAAKVTWEEFIAACKSAPQLYIPSLDDSRGEVTELTHRIDHYRRVLFMHAYYYTSLKAVDDKLELRRQVVEEADNKRRRIVEEQYDLEQEQENAEKESATARKSATQIRRVLLAAIVGLLVLSGLVAPACDLHACVGRSSQWVQIVLTVITAFCALYAVVVEIVDRRSEQKEEDEARVRAESLHNLKLKLEPLRKRTRALFWTNFCIEQPKEENNPTMQHVGITIMYPDL